jgi:hypothetical protein
VRASAQLYKTAYLDTIDNIFKIARAIEILNKRYRGSGSPEVDPNRTLQRSDPLG